ncbi:MAG: peptidoglycan-binding protein [Microthrixaceae bacterium]
MTLPLTRGSNGTSVGELRRRLALLDYATDPDPRDQFGQATHEAIAAFQADHGLDPTGECDHATWTMVIESEHSLGDRLLCLRAPMLRGEDVADLQLRLGTLGFDSGRVDGIFGPSTQGALGEFQRNAGIVFDQICGPDTVAALHRLEGRAGSSTVASVRERVKLQTSAPGMERLRISIGAYGPDVLTASALAAMLAPLCAAVQVTEGEDSTQASAANGFDADVHLAIEFTPTDEIEARYFSVPGFESWGGRSLAEAMISELPATGLGIARGMRLPILRETRAPAVSVRIGHGLGAPKHRDLVAASMVRALTRWATTD